MAANSYEKADLSVDNVQTRFGLTKPSPAKALRSGNEPELKNFDAGSRSHVVLSTPTHEEV